jgi:dihydroneopterin aldolase
MPTSPAPLSHRFLPAVLHIRNLQLQCIIGTDPDERVTPQPVCIQIQLWCDIATAVESDDLRQALDYREVYNQIVSMVEASQFFLIEKLVHAIAQVCLAHEKTQKVTVTLEKIAVLPHTEKSGIELTLEK